MNNEKQRGENTFMAKNPLMIKIKGRNTVQINTEYEIKLTTTPKSLDDMVGKKCYGLKSLEKFIK